MKHFFKLLLLGVIFLSMDMRAQGQLEIFGLRSWAVPRPAFTDKGWGGGINYLCRPLSLNGKENPHPLHFQIGGQFYMCSLGRHKLKNVPLAEPQMGNATVKFNNVILAGNLFVRFSTPNLITGYTPYVDFLAGRRSISSQMTVYPQLVPIGYDRSTTSELKSAGGRCFGVGAGLQKKISDNANFDFELIWSYSPVSNSIVDMTSVGRSGDGITYDVRNSPNSVFLLKLGFNFTVQNSHSGIRSGWHHSPASNEHTTQSQHHSSTVHVYTGGGHSSGGVHGAPK